MSLSIGERVPHLPAVCERGLRQRHDSQPRQRRPRLHRGPRRALYANGAFCDANTIHGSVSLINTPGVNPISHEGSEIEGNTVTGSMFVHSMAEVWANAIGGGLLAPTAR